MVDAGDPASDEESEERSVTTADCGCWTDGDGFWQLSDKCRRAELDQWKKMMDDYRSGKFDSLTPVPTGHAHAVAYFRQELGDLDI